MALTLPPFSVIMISFFKNSLELSPKAMTYPPMKLLHVTKPKQRCQEECVLSVNAIVYLFHLLSHHIFP